MRAKGILLLVAVAGTTANAQTNCTGRSGPDVIVGDVSGVSNYAAVGTLDAISLGTTSCNPGDTWLNWIQSTNQHPVVGQNMFKYKLSDFAGTGVPYARFEQMSQSWLKNTFFALSQSLCCTGCVSTDGTHLGVHCSDPYTSGRNGSQSGMEPKWQVNAHTGAFTYPPANPSFSSSVDRRSCYSLSEAEASSATVRYFGECQYVTPDDAAAGNQNNNSSYREMTMSITGTFPNATESNLTTISSTVREKLALEVWKTIDPTVTQTEIAVPEMSGGPTGRVLMCSKATNLNNGFWHYEFAVHNQNSDRSIGGFSIPLPAGATVQNVGFHDVTYRTGDGIGNIDITSTDWAPVVSSTGISWSCQDFATNANGNAIRWGTMYNFRFDTNVAPAAGGVATLSTWKTGAGFPVASLQGAAQVPATGCYANCDGSTSAPCLNVGDFNCFVSRFAQNDTYANCDASTLAPVLNVNDFVCYVNKFATGCSSC